MSRLPSWVNRSNVAWVGAALAVGVFIVALDLQQADDFEGRLQGAGWDVIRVDVSSGGGWEPFPERELEVLIDGGPADANRLCALLSDSDEIGARDYRSEVFYRGDRSVSLDC